MNRLITIPSAFCFFVLLFCSAVPGQTNADVQKPTEFELSVNFGRPWVELIEFKSRIKPDVPFVGTVADKNGKIYKLGGMLLPEKDGQYRLVLTTVPPDGGDVSTMVQILELNKAADTSCSVGSIVRDCVAPKLSSLKVTDEKKSQTSLDKDQL